MLHVGSHCSRYHLRYNLCRSCLHRCALQHVICVPVMCCSGSRLPFIELHVSPFQPCRPQAGDTMYIQFTTKTRLLLLSIHTKTELRYDFVSIIYMFIYIMASRKTARRPLCWATYRAGVGWTLFPREGLCMHHNKYISITLINICIYCYSGGITTFAAAQAAPMAAHHGETSCLPSKNALSAINTWRMRKYVNIIE